MSRTAATTEGWSDGARSACGSLWEEATRHRFVRAIADDTLADEAYAAYLVQDSLFIDALVRLVAHGVAVAPGVDEQRRLAGFLSLLVSDENDYFERSFAALGVTPEARAPERRNEVTHAFEDLFRAARAEGSYAAVLGALVPVEWVYLDWARWVARAGHPSARFWLREWVELHSGEAFVGFVAWLCAELDREVRGASAAAQARLAARFRRAVLLERDFFAAALQEREGHED